MSLFEPPCLVGETSKTNDGKDNRNHQNDPPTKEQLHAEHMTTLSASDLGIILRRMRMLFGASRIGATPIMILLSYTCCTSLLSKLHTPSLRRHFHDATTILAALAPRVHCADRLLSVLLAQVRVESPIILVETEALLRELGTK